MSPRKQRVPAGNVRPLGGFGGVGASGQSKGADGEDAQGRHDTKFVAVADLGAVFDKGDVADPAQAVVDHRLHQISTQLEAVGEGLSQLDEIRASLRTLTESLQSTGTITTPPVCPLSDGEDGSAAKSRRRLLSLRPAGSDA